MITLREAAQQALEALEGGADSWQRVGPAVDALRAALAEPVQEPVTWRWGYRSITTGEMDWRGYVEIPSHPNLRSPAIIMEPLYTAPPQRKPLTEDDIALILADCSASTHRHDDFHFVRAIERAHGIE